MSFFKENPHLIALIYEMCVVKKRVFTGIHAEITFNVKRGLGHGWVFINY